MRSFRSDTTLAFTDTGLSPGVTYGYRVRALDVAGNLSPYSGTASAATASGPATPAFVQVAFATPQTPQTSVGVTFAGAARPWRKIRKFLLKPDHVEVDCEAGPLVLGPAPQGQLDAIAAAIKSHLGATPHDRTTTLESPFD